MVNVPKLSIKNKSGFPSQPIELKLHPLEERLISPIIPFMTIRELPVGGQKLLHGNICHVPVDVSLTVNSSPHCLQDTENISVKMKCKNCYKTVMPSENAQPTEVVKALQYQLQNSELFQNQNIHIDET